MLRITKQLFLMALIAGIMTSCYTTQVTVGDVSQSAKTEKYSKSKQFYLFWGIVPLGKNDPSTPSDDYIVESKFKFGDFLISGLTGGIVGARTSIVLVEKE